MIVVKLPLIEGTQSRRDYVELYFQNKKRCGADPYLTVVARDEFLFLVYKCEKDCCDILAKEHKIGQIPILVFMNSLHLVYPCAHFHFRSD